MKRPDLISSIVAGFVGAFALLAIVKVFDSFNTARPALYPTEDPAGWLLLGFVVGAITQVGVRLTGVS
jgi:hypothetical protein